MPDGTRKSLSREEHAIRVQFEGAPRDSPDARRVRYWGQLQAERGRGATASHRLYVNVRVRDHADALAACLIADFKNVAWIRDPTGLRRPDVIGGTVPCELMFNTSLPPCTQDAPCPHEVQVYVIEADNCDTPILKRAREDLMEIAARRLSA